MRSDVFRLVADVRLAVRRLRRAPMFVAAAVAMLGAGLAVGTALVNVIDGALYGSMPTPANAVHFVSIARGSAERASAASDQVARVLADPPASIAWVAGDRRERTTMRIGDRSEPVSVEAVNAPYVTAFGVVPRAGRLFNEDDDRVGAPLVAVIGERLWRSRFGADPTVVGTTTILAGQPVVIVGVAAAPFHGASLEVTDAWVTSRLLPPRGWFEVFAGLRPGVTLPQANAEIQTRYATDDAFERTTLEVRPGTFDVSAPTRVFVLVGAVLVVGWLVIAVAGLSLALLFIARVSTSTRDVALRLMLGGRLVDVVRVWAAEVALVAALAGGVGVAAAARLGRAAIDYFNVISGVWTLSVDTTPDWRVIVYAGTALAVVTAGVVLAAAWRIARVPALAALSAETGAGGATDRAAVARTRLIAAETAVVTLLMMLAAVVGRSALAGATSDEGFDPMGVAIAALDQTASPAASARTRLANRQALAAVRSAPEIANAALVESLPGGGSSVGARSDNGATLSTEIHAVTPELFDVIRLRFLGGRHFTDAEDASASPVTIVSASAAAAFWPSRNAIGRHLSFEIHSGDWQETTVVGVIADAGAPLADAPWRRDVYVPFDSAISRRWSANIVARGAGPAALVADRVRTVVDRNVPAAGLLSVGALVDALGEGTQSAALAARLLAVFAGVGLVIAVLGIYGIAAYLTGRRIREFGIRKALGATNVTICRMVAIEQVPPLLAGVGIGSAFAILVALSLTGRYPSLHVFDVPALLSVGVLLVSAGLLGALLPVWRVLRKDPSAALREF